MTLQINDVDVMAAIEVAAVVGGIISMLVVGLLIYLMVRPPRHVREARRRPAEPREDEVEQMLALIDRMESRLEVLERALADVERPRVEAAEQRILEPAGEGRETRRTK